MKRTPKTKPELVQRRFTLTIVADEQIGKGKLRALIGARLAKVREIVAVRVAYAPDPAPKKAKPARKPPAKARKTAAKPSAPKAKKKPTRKPAARKPAAKKPARKTAKAKRWFA